jgi:hypothetical protein
VRPLNLFCDFVVNYSINSINTGLYSLIWHFCLVVLLSCDRMFFTCLSSADQSHAACVCVISMHAADSFAVSSRALINICHVFIVLYKIIFPRNVMFREFTSVVMETKNQVGNTIQFTTSPTTWVSLPDIKSSKCRFFFIIIWWKSTHTLKKWEIPMW